MYNWIWYPKNGLYKVRAVLDFSKFSDLKIVVPSNWITYNIIKKD
jgi:hypothetical protein